MLVHPGVVGRALERVVERDLHAEAIGGRDERVEVVDVAELGVDRRVPTRLVADGPGAPGVAGADGTRVVRSLARGVADGVDRRQVHHVEPHGRDRIEAADGAAQAALRAREELVPGPHERPLPVDPEGVGLRGRVVGVGVRRRVPGTGGAVAGDPRLDDQLVAAQVGGLDDRLPAVEAGRDEAHRLVPPLAVADGSPAHPRAQGIVAVLEDGGADGHRLADHRLRRIAPGRGARAHVVDDDATDHPS